MKKIVALTALLAAIQISCYAESPKAVYTLPDAVTIGSVYNFEYKPESLYEINCKAGYITDIALKPGSHCGRGYFAVDGGPFYGRQCYAYLCKAKSRVSAYQYDY